MCARGGCFSNIFLSCSIKNYIYLENLFFIQIEKRFIINLGSFKVKIVDKDGVHALPDIKPIQS